MISLRTSARLGVPRTSRMQYCSSEYEHGNANRSIRGQGGERSATAARAERHRARPSAGTVYSTGVAMTKSLAPSDRTRVRRIPARATYDSAQINGILDEALVCHVGLV